MRNLFGGVLTLVLGLSLGACGSDERTRPGPDTGGAVFQEHVPVQVARATEKLGADCTAGASACESNVCLHVGRERGSGYVCSVRCSPQAPCPAGWSCRAIHPADGSEFCLPVSR